MSDVTDDHAPAEVPDDWDHLAIEDDEPGVDDNALTREHGRQGGPSLALIAASWGDLALVLAVCAVTLVALKIAGYGAPFAAAWWALALAVLWWLVAAGMLLAIRRGTPGMLLAGVQFSEPVPPNRIAPVLLTALVMGATLGLPAAVGPPGWALTAAAGTRITTAAPDGT